jgi:hypothetical protein
LQYQPWQLQAPQQPLQPAADFDAVPFTVVDSPDALAAMVAQLQGQQQIALDVEHHSYRWGGWRVVALQRWCAPTSGGQTQVYSQQTQVAATALLLL